MPAMGQDLWVSAQAPPGAASAEPEVRARLRGCRLDSRPEAQEIVNAVQTREQVTGPGGMDFHV